MLEGCWQRALAIAVAMLFAFVQSPDWSSALDYKGSWVVCLPSGRLRAWDSGSHWFHRESTAWYPLWFKKTKTKTTFLKLFSKWNTVKHRRDARAALLSLAPTLATLRCRLEQLIAVLGPSCAHTAAAAAVPLQNCPVSLWFSLFLCEFNLWLSPCELDTICWGRRRGRCAASRAGLGSLAQAGVSCINDGGNTSLLGHNWWCLS